jgi:hypothetical protein
MYGSVKILSEGTRAIARVRMSGRFIVVQRVGFMGFACHSRSDALPRSSKLPTNKRTGIESLNIKRKNCGRRSQYFRSSNQVYHNSICSLCSIE